jgi:hypothetical protein
MVALAVFLDFDFLAAGAFAFLIPLLLLATFLREDV